MHSALHHSSSTLRILCGISLAALALVWLAGCGYQLQRPLLASTSVQANYQPVFVDAQAAWAVALQRELMANDVRVTTQRNAAASVIRLVATPQPSRSLSVSADGRDAEILRSVTASLNWHSGSRTLLPDTDLRAEHTQVANPARRAAQQRESELIDSELMRALMAKVLQQLRYAQTDAQ